MPPKKVEAPEKKPLIGRVGTNLKVGIVGIPNVGKSTFFNVLTKSEAAAENFPFCTIDPNENKYFFIVITLPKCFVLLMFFTFHTSNYFNWFPSLMIRFFFISFQQVAYQYQISDLIIWSIISNQPGKSYNVLLNLRILLLFYLYV